MSPHYPIAKVAVFNDTRGSLHYGCEYVMQILGEQLGRRNITPVMYWPVGKDWRNEIHKFGDLGKPDAIIVNGEGSIHHSSTRPRAHYLTETARFFAEKYDIPSFLINATLHEIGDDIVDNLRYFHGIWVRESASMKLLNARGLSAQVAPDLTLMVAAPRAPQRPLSVLITDSVIQGDKQFLRALGKKKKWDFTKLIHSSRPVPQDDIQGLEVLRRYAKWLAALLMLKNTRNRHEFVQFMASHKLVCTGRFHAVTLALATKTPYLAVESNTPKISSLTMDVFGTLDRVVSLADLESVDDPAAFGWSRPEHDALTGFLVSARAGITAMFDEIRATMDSCAGRAKQ